jgi:hypothetical protein
MLPRLAGGGMRCRCAIRTCVLPGEPSLPRLAGSVLVVERCSRRRPSGSRSAGDVPARSASKKEARHARLHSAPRRRVSQSIRAATPPLRARPLRASRATTTHGSGNPNPRLTTARQRRNGRYPRLQSANLDRPGEWRPRPHLPCFLITASQTSFSCISMVWSSGVPAATATSCWSTGLPSFCAASAATCCCDSQVGDPSCMKSA